MIEEIEAKKLDLLIDVIFFHYQYDFREYAKTSFTRRINSFLKEENIDNIEILIDFIIKDEKNFNKLLSAISVNVTEMFRNPLFFKFVKKVIIPHVLTTYPFLKIWIAGCSSGEEVFSLAIILQEEGILNKCQIIATDFDRNILEIAQSGSIPLAKMKLYSTNYLKAGGQNSLLNYFKVDNNFAYVKDFLKENINFQFHNLVSDPGYEEINLIFCRNVIIYFDQELQNKILTKFYNSLCYNGILCLGDKESIRFSDVEKSFLQIEKTQKVFQKKVIYHE
jgi:chemotaxis protein methyltransferase CheR